MAQKPGDGKKPPTKSQILGAIAEKTGISKRDTAAVFEALNDEIAKHVGKRGAGTFAIPGIVKIERKKVPARPARKGVPNPFKPGELMDVPPRPASVKVKVRPLKALKDML